MSEQRTFFGVSSDEELEEKLFKFCFITIQRLLRALIYAVAAFALSISQPHYDFSSIAIFVVVFGLASTNRMRWVSECIIVILMILVFVPQSLVLKLASVL